MNKITITSEEASQRLDKFLKRYLPEAGGSFLYKQLRKKNIVLNGKKSAGSEMLREGDEITIWFSDETLQKFMGLSRDAGAKKQQKVLPASWIVYEDDWLLAVNKPAGILSQPAEGDDVSVDGMIREYLLESGQMTEKDFLRYRPGTLNRIDRNTSGLILAAKTLPAAQQLSRMIRDREIRKYYLALVCGICAEKQKMDAWLVKDSRTNSVRVTADRTEGASHIQTACEPVRTLKLCGRPYTLLSVELITGKTHQIRAHLSFIGHPIAGDVKYGISDANRELREHFGLKRQFLHAYRMVFPDTEAGYAPGTADGVLTAPLPDPLRTILEAGEE